MTVDSKTSARPEIAAPTSIDIFDRALDLEITPAEQLRRIREQAPKFKEWLKSTGTVDGFSSHSLITLPYPRRYALWDACSAPGPYVWFTNRVFIVQWTDEGGTLRTLLAEPSDFEHGYDTPFFRWEYDHIAKYSRKVADHLVKKHAHVSEVLVELGIRPEDIDYVSFDHLHTQDIRRIVGTTAPQPDIGYADEPVPSLFPNAKLIVHRHEYAHVCDVHPFQERFHQSWTYSDIDEDKLLFIDGDVQLGPGIALMYTPGHTLGNHSLVINTEERGIFTSSENGVSVDCYSPKHSKLPGVAKWAERWGFEVLMNFNTPEYSSLQYNSMVKEKLVADPIPDYPHFSQVYPSSELTTHKMSPRIKPAYQHGDLTIGTIRPTN